MVPWVLFGFELRVAVFGLGARPEGLEFFVDGDIAIIRYCGDVIRLVPDLCYQGLGLDRGPKPKGAGRRLGRGLV